MAARHRYVPPYAVALVHAGLTHPHVTVTRIDRPTRTPVGKRLRFVPDDRPPHTTLATSSASNHRTPDR